MLRLLAVLLVALVFADAATAQPEPRPAEPPAKVQDLLQLLGDPTVRAWLAERGAAPASVPVRTEAEPEMAGRMASRLAAIRVHLRALAAALPSLPAEIGRALNVLKLELEENGLWHAALLLVGFVALGLGTERVFRWATRRARARILELPLATPGERLRGVALRLAFATALVVVFAAGSVGAFLAFDWPARLREIVLLALLAMLALRFARVAAIFLLAPGYRRLPDLERFRVVPMSTTSARFWARRLRFAIGWFAVGWAGVTLLGALGLPLAHREIVAYALGLGLLAIGIEMVWRRPHLHAGGSPAAHGHGVGAWLISAYLVLLWGLWVAGTMPLFWTAAVALALPLALRVAGRAVTHILRPMGTPHAAAAMPSVAAVCLERGVRAVFIIGAALVLAEDWNIDLTMLTARETLGTRLLRGALGTVVVVLLADFAWNLAKAAIDSRLVAAETPSDDAPVDSEEAHRRARIRTLLPILRNFILVVVAGLAVMMALAALGVEIGPLIAGAGVAGVAIGFGAQTLVRDIISGMFYLLDDAFRIGEYIQSATYKGTVESFSLRSVKLRHHRGPLYTVPFGVLGAIQNMSRDWVIDKLSVGVAYDADLDKVKKIVKQIGKELAENPEFQPHILEPLKMQGVEAFGDYAIQIRMKMKTRPNEQFVIRRRAFARIKQEFDAQGIRFASPTVRVAGHDANGLGGYEAAEIAGAARQALTGVKPTAA
jgi:small-conductance mechanosensitive channel